ncbi:MAG: class II SORL domain-containing protein [Sporomusaceae bacterium]|nr:class II SORL domain-containing protein [Sporomusaceae bacterium]
MKLADVVQSGEWKAEKHVPVIEAPSSVKAGEKVKITLSVGKEIAHPNTTEHHIRWIKLFFKPADGKFVYELGTFDFNAHGEAVAGANQGPAYTEPTSEVVVKLTTSGTLLASSYCNIHGLWESSQEITVEA